MWECVTSTLVNLATSWAGTQVSTSKRRIQILRRAGALQVTLWPPTSQELCQQVFCARTTILETMELDKMSWLHALGLHGRCYGAKRQWYSEQGVGRSTPGPRAKPFIKVCLALRSLSSG